MSKRHQPLRVLAKAIRLLFRPGEELLELGRKLLIVLLQHERELPGRTAHARLVSLVELVPIIKL